MRSMGVFDNMMDSVRSMAGTKPTAEQQQKQVAEMFKMQQDYVLECEDFGFEEFLTLLQSQRDMAKMDGWQKMFRTEAEQRQMEAQFKNVNLAEELLDEERDTMDRIGRRDMLAIADRLSTDLKEVQQLVQAYSMQVQVAKWLRMRKAEGKPLPSSMEEQQVLMMTDNKGFGRKKAHRFRSPRKSRR